MQSLINGSKSPEDVLADLQAAYEEGKSEMGVGEE